MLECERTTADGTFHDIVHDNNEMYPVADEKYRDKAGARLVHARCEDGAPMQDVAMWPQDCRAKLRKVSRMLVEVWLYPGQRLLYDPIGKAGAKT